MRFGYLITSYQSARQVGRLVRAIHALSPGADIFVAQDRRRAELDPRDVEPAELLPPLSQPVEWGGWAFVDQQVMGVRHAFVEASCDWLTVVSAQDYPVAPLHDLEQRLETEDARFLVEEFDARANHDALVGRYHRVSIGYPHVLQGILERRNVVRLLNRSRVLHVQGRARGLPPVLELKQRCPLAPGERVRVGNNWWSMQRTAGLGLLDRYEHDVALREHFRRTFIPSEAYIHTVVLNDTSVTAVTDFVLQYARWTGWSPADLSLDDVDAAVGSGLPFARKFAEDDPALDRIDDLLSIDSRGRGAGS